MRLPRSRRALRVALASAAIAGAVAIAALAAAGRGPRATAQTPPVESIVPAAQTIAAGDPYTQFDVTVEGVSNLGAYEVLLQYESTVLAFPSAGDPFLGAENGPFLGSGGRSVTCQPPIVTDVPATTQKRLRFGCNTIGPGVGASGSGVLATIRLKPVGIGASALVLTPSMSDPLGNDIFATAMSGAVAVTSGPTSTPTATNTPCPGSCPTPTDTPTPAPFCNAATSPEICFEPSSVIGNPGVEMDVDVNVAAVSNLGAVSFEADYDPDLLEFAGFTPGPFLPSTGRTLFCLPASLDTGAVRQTCVTLGASPSGPSGGGTIGQLAFVPRHNGTGTLHFSDATLVTPDVQAIPPAGAAARSDADVTIVDCTGPCATVTPSPTPTRSPTASATPSATSSATPTACGGPCPTATNTPTAPAFTPTPTPSDASVAIDPAALTASPGEPFSLRVGVAGASNVGAFQFTLRYQVDVVSFFDAQPGAFLGSTGRTVQCNAPLIGAGEATFGCFTYDAGGAQAAAQGSGTLADLALSGCGAASSQIELTNVVLITPGATPLPLGAVSGANVTFDGAGACPTPTATSTPCSASCPTPTDTATPRPGSPTSTPDASGAAFGSIMPSSTQVMPGQQITVDVDTSNVSDLGAYEFTLSFAPESPPLMFQYDGVEDRGFLGSTGRQVFCQPPVVTAVSVRFGCATSGQAEGPSGGGTLARVTLTAWTTGRRTWRWSCSSSPIRWGHRLRRMCPVRR